MQIALAISVVVPTTEGVVSTGPTNGYLLEDGTSFYLTEDGDYYIQES